jgi:hypothetical protein
MRTIAVRIIFLIWKGVKMQLTVAFTETPYDEIKALMQDLRFSELARLLASGQQLSSEMTEVLGQFVHVISDLFSDGIPNISDNPDVALRTVSRDINLSRILRERGIFRLHLLLNQKDSNGLPVYMSLDNPVTGSPFATQEEFIGWFCGEASVSRSLIFMRLASIERLLSLGFSREEALNTIMSKPYAVRETLNSVAEWNKGRLVSVDLDGITRLAERLQPESLPMVEEMVTAVREGNDPDALSELNEVAKPIIASLMKEVTVHSNAKDALLWVKHNLLLQSDVAYSFDNGVLVATLVTHSIDPTTKEEVVSPPVIIPFVPDTNFPVPDEVLADLSKRLPIRNKSQS